MKNIIFLFLLFTTLSFSQVTEKWLSDSGDSTWIYFNQSEWLEFIVIDSTDSDTLYVEYPTPGGYAKISIWNLKTNTKDTLAVAETGVDGNVFMVYAPYPRAVRFHMNSLDGELYVKVIGKPN